jgi:hypothetical protein
MSMVEVYLKMMNPTKITKAAGIQSKGGMLDLRKGCDHLHLSESVSQDPLIPVYRSSLTS